MPNRLMELLREAGAPDGLVQVIHGGKPQVEGAAGASGRARRQLRRLGARRQGDLHGSRHEREAGAGARRRQEPPGDHARRRQEAGHRELGRGHLRRRGSALHGDQRRGAGRRGVGMAGRSERGDGGGASGALGRRRRGLRTADHALCARADNSATSSRASRRARAACWTAASAKWTATPTATGSGRRSSPGSLRRCRSITNEIFGPVLVTSSVDTLDDAIGLVNANPYGNGVSLFTSSGGAARRFQREIQVGQVGINIPIPGAAAVLFVQPAGRARSSAISTPTARRRCASTRRPRP